MGYMKHNSIIVTTMYDRKRLECARTRAKKIFGKHAVSTVVHGDVNGVTSFFISPDGSKEGWPESDHGDENRNEFIAYLRSIYYEDGCPSLDWVEMQYGDDERSARVIRGSDKDFRRFEKIND